MSIVCKTNSTDAHSKSEAIRSSNEIIAMMMAYRVRRSCQPREREKHGQMTKPFVILPKQLVWAASP